MAQGASGRGTCLRAPQPERSTNPSLGEALAWRTALRVLRLEPDRWAESARIRPYWRRRYATDAQKPLQRRALEGSAGGTWISGTSPCVQLCDGCRCNALRSSLRPELKPRSSYSRLTITSPTSLRFTGGRVFSRCQFNRYRDQPSRLTRPNFGEPSTGSRFCSPPALAPQNQG